MNKVKIIVDSACNIDLEIAKKYNIDVISYIIRFGEESFVDLYQISPKKFFKKYKTSDQRVTSSIPSMSKFIEILENSYKEGYREIICFSLSKKLSGMYQMMKLSSDMFMEKFSDSKIKIIDTDTGTLACFYPCIEAAKMAEKGVGFERIIEKSMENLKKANTQGLVRNFDALIKGGRLPKPIGKLANLVSFSPILSLDQGEIKIVKKVTGKKKSYKEFVKYLKKTIGAYDNYYLAIAGADCEKDLDKLQKDLDFEIKQAKKFDRLEITSVIGVHLGCGVIMASLFPLD